MPCVTDIVLKALQVPNFPLFSHSRLLCGAHKTMQASSLVCYFLLVSLCTDFCPAEAGAGRRQRRRMRQPGLGRSPRAGPRAPRTRGMEPPRIPLIHIDDSVMGVFDSLVGLGEHESTYSVLPGENRAPLLLAGGSLFISNR